MANPYLLLWLEGPLQSWGFDSKFGRRDTMNFPTKSGLMGMVCCALGASGAQKKMLAEFANLDLQIKAYVRKDKVGNPVHAEPLLRDFHMIGSGYNARDPLEKLHIPKTSDGKKAVGGGTKITYRYYLQDVSFAAALQVPANYSEKLVKHFQCPVWDLYLGRKSCAPTDFIFQCQCKTAADAFLKADKLADTKNKTPYLIVLQGRHNGDEVISLYDVPLKFGPDKLYKDRVVSVIRI